MSSRASGLGTRLAKGRAMNHVSQRHRRRLRAPVLTLVVALLPGIASAQRQAADSQPSAAPSASTPGACDGLTIRDIMVDPERPPFTGTGGKWRRVARALGLHHATTHADVVRAYLLVKPGGVCSARALAESERVLRTLPFLSDARVTSRADSSGGVVVGVRTVDEIPVLVAGALSHGSPAALALGNENVGGRGVRILAGARRGGMYRDAGVLEFAQYAFLGLPVVAQARAEHASLGGNVALDLAYPLLSTLQRVSWHGSFYGGHDFPAVIRPIGDDEAIDVHDRRWSMSGLIAAQLGAMPTLAGPVLLGAKLEPTSRVVLVTESGPIDTVDPSISSRLDGFNTTWIGASAALRRVHYVTRTSLETLFATQDVMTGWQIGALAAPGFGTRRDVLFATSFTTGFTTPRTVLASDLEAELRSRARGGGQPSSVANLQVAWFFTPSPRLTLSIRDNFSNLHDAWLPTQLTLGDPLGGARGYMGSSIAGGIRNVARNELRWANAAAIRHADVGVALFVDAAQMWADDVPYGVTTSRQSIGFSVLAAYPTRSKRVYRVDVAFPLQRERGRAGVEVRFTGGSPQLAAMLEPLDVTRARVAPVPSSIFGWPDGR